MRSMMRPVTTPPSGTPGCSRRISTAGCAEKRSARSSLVVAPERATTSSASTEPKSLGLRLRTRSVTPPIRPLRPRMLQARKCLAESALLPSDVTHETDPPVVGPQLAGNVGCFLEDLEVSTVQECARACVTRTVCSLQGIEKSVPVQGWMIPSSPARTAPAA